MPEATTICPQCGNELAPDTAECPHCGAHLVWEQQIEAQQVEAPPVSGFRGAIQSILATTKTHRMWWAGGAGGVVVVALAAIVAFGGFFGPSGKLICTATLNQAHEYGVIAPEATLASNSAESTDVTDRRKCTAQVGNDTYVLLVNLQAEDIEHKKCKDFDKQPGCIKLYSVARSDGMTTYQVREIPPDQTDEALLGSAGQAGTPPPAAATDSGVSDPGSLESETAVDNSSGAQPAPQQSAPAQTPPATDQPQQ